MKLGTFLSVALSLVCLGGVAQAQNTLSAGSATTSGGDVNVDISLDSVDIAQGWSFGVCNTSDVMVGTVLDGPATEALNGGNGPDFNQINMFPEGWTVGVVISFLGMDTLAPGTGYVLNVAPYTPLTVPAAGDPDVVAPLDFCGTLGTPPVATVIVVGGQSITPDQVSGAITIQGAPPAPPSFTYIAPTQDVQFDAGSFTANFAIEQNPDGDLAFPIDTQGFSMGNENGALVAPTAVNAIGDLASLSGGAGPDFFGDNTFANGWTVGVVYAFLGGVFIQFDTAKEVIGVDYDINGAAAGDSETLTWVGTLGTPPVSNVVVVAGQSIGTAAADGAINFIEVVIPSVDFIRGDCNDDGIVNIADGVWIINELFLSGPSSVCPAACDANADGMRDQSDAVYIWNYRFLGGAPPSAPFPACGESLDADDVALGCDGGSCP